MMVNTADCTKKMHQPHYEQQEEFQNRLRKLKELKALNINPYPHKFIPTATTAELESQYKNKEVGSSEDAAAQQENSYTVAGRLVLFRAMGKNAFGHIQDDKGRIQIMFNRDLTAVEEYTPNTSEKSQDPKPIKVIEKKFDLGDIIGVEGHLFRTQKGELTLYAKKVTLLCKTLLPLAEKHAGLHDKELRYRKRWLDLISNPEVKDTFRVRSTILRHLRAFLEERGFLEVETPVLQSLYGGAEARPFTTNLHAMDQEMFMRISLEIPLKKLIVGGLDKVFEIGRVFRNEGIDRNHNPEFTLMEAYASYWDYNDMMVLIETLFEKVALELYQTTKIPLSLSADEEPLLIDMKAPWPRLTMKESIYKFGQIDVESMSDDEIRTEIQKHEESDPKELKKLSRGLLIAALFEVVVEPHLIQPHHITDHPIETTPLCKPHRHTKEREEGLVERFESFIGGQEISNAYSELNDPVLQKELLEKQGARKDSGDDEAAPYDGEFVEAICQGMPPTGGIGIGIDRMVMLFTNSHSIRDVLFFPWMKVKED